MGKYSYYLIFVISVFLLFGFLMVYSASAFNDITTTTELSLTNGKKQFLYIIFGLILFIITSFIDYKKYERYTYIFYILTIGVLLLLFIGLGKEVNGSTRWIKVGPFNLQPSEFAKITIIIYLAHSLSKKNIKLLKQFYIGVVPHIIFTGIIMLLILAEPDFGTFSIIGMLLFTMMVIAGVKWRDVVVPSIILAIAGYFLISMSTYRSARFKAFLNPWEHRQTTGYQLVESILAFSSGGITGVGLGNSFQKRYYLPEAHTDFIGSIIGEELGFLGTTFLIILYIILFFIGVKIALSAETLFGVYVAMGISILIFAQALTNLAVVLGAFPTKGLTLPFISFGGSSMLSIMIMMGILLNISKHRSPDGVPLVYYSIDPDEEKGKKRKKTVKKKTVKKGKKK